MLSRFINSLTSAYLAYPLAKLIEGRHVTSKVKQLRYFYSQPFSKRKLYADHQLANMIEYAGTHVPYYRDLFQNISFDPAKIRQDIRFLEDIPYLTKDIIREQGERMLSKPLSSVRHHHCKTGGSTGISCSIYYDQEAADASAAVTLYARQTANKRHTDTELHFASRFPDVFPWKDRLREHVKCFVMNRTNLFFDRLDDSGLELIWSQLEETMPMLVHSHPSTMYALACYVEKKYGIGHAFSVFESSGELLEHYMREKIEHVLMCKTIDRYGLAEFGVIAYESPQFHKLQVLDSEGWIEQAGDISAPQNEIVFTGFRNYLMPLIRLKTGDRAHITETEDGIFLSNMLGRIHDIITIAGIAYPTHYIQDVLDRVGGITEFQVDARTEPPILRLVLQDDTHRESIRERLQAWWQDGLAIEFITLADIIRVGQRAKFRHIIDGKSA